MCTGENLNFLRAAAEEDSNNVSGFSRPSDTMSEWVRCVYFSTRLNFDRSVDRVFQLNAKSLN